MSPPRRLHPSTISGLVIGAVTVAVVCWELFVEDSDRDTDTRDLTDTSASETTAAPSSPTRTATERSTPKPRRDKPKPAPGATRTQAPEPPDGIRVEGSYDAYVVPDTAARGVERAGLLYGYLFKPDPELAVGIAIDVCERVAYEGWSWEEQIADDVSVGAPAR